MGKYKEKYKLFLLPLFHKLINVIMSKCKCLCASGTTPLLLLPENIRIRRFNLQTEAYHDFLREEEHIMALDYDWDHNDTGLSGLHTD